MGLAADLRRDNIKIMRLQMSMKRLRQDNVCSHPESLSESVGSGKEDFCEYSSCMKYSYVLLPGTYPEAQRRGRISGTRHSFGKRFGSRKPPWSQVRCKPDLEFQGGVL